MPNIYTDEVKLNIKTDLMNEARHVIIRDGYNKLRIENLTKKVGIAQGTFYHFFKTKEALILEMALSYQHDVDAHVKELIAHNGFITSDDFTRIYQNMFLSDENNIFRYLRRADIEHLISRLSVDIAQLYEASQATMDFVLTNLKNPRKDVDKELIFNLIQLLNLTIENKDLLIKNALEKTVTAIIHQMVSEIFESQETEENHAI
ncbi:MAG TPA: hypothetical protein DCS67_00460 [Clostridiales bacterium UBA8960]|nr:hypothetical protein [Clostridiales bacterium UBA8960]